MENGGGGGGVCLVSLTYSRHACMNVESQLWWYPGGSSTIEYTQCVALRSELFFPQAFMQARVSRLQLLMSAFEFFWSCVWDRDGFILRTW